MRIQNLKNEMNPSKVLLCFCLAAVFMFAFTPNNPKEDTKIATLQALLDSNMVSASGVGLGDYQGYCVELSLKNNTSNTLSFYIEPGRKLICSDSSMQDILIVKRLEVQLSPSQSVKKQVYGFCCRAHRSSPRKGIPFLIGKMAEKELVAVAEYISKVDSLPIQKMQDVIWSISDNRTLTINPKEENADVRGLVLLAAHEKKIEYPWYTIEYGNNRDTTLLYADNYSKLVGEITYRVRTNGPCQVFLRNDKGQVVKILAKDMWRNSGIYAFDVNLVVKDWPKGEYHVIGRQEGNIILFDKKFELQ